jgi:hypothetical protein
MTFPRSTRGKTMADSSVSVSGPVSVQSDSKARVAYDLMHRIMSYEKDVERTRDYHLTLYRQCYKAVDGEILNYILDRTK